VTLNPESEASQSAYADATFWFLIDGDCGLCQRWAKFAKILGAGALVQFVPFNTINPQLAQWGLTHLPQSNQAWLLKISPTGQVVWAKGGAAAVNTLLTLLPGWRNAGLRGLGALYQVPWLQPIENALYRWVANNRYRLMGKTNATVCGLPPLPPSSPAD
jgi:predicted DCC family thiol-disulfide oxidoreductase YuxK